MHNPIRLYMWMSLGGCIAGPDDRPGQERWSKLEIHLVPDLLGDGRRLRYQVRGSGEAA